MTDADDHVGARALREVTLASWSANPDRFREDANAEEDLALGAYAGRVVVELTQNAADAAVRAGVPGRLLLRLAGNVLVAANTGAPLDAAGVRALASLRASAKRESGHAGHAGHSVVGRFGVGAASTVGVADEVTWWTAAGDGVCFSRSRTAAALARAGAVKGTALGREVLARGESLPILRLPWGVSAPSPVPTGYDTAVVLALRDAAAVATVRAQLAAVDDVLLLALPALAEVVVEDDGAHDPRRHLHDPQERWHVLRRSGDYGRAALAGLGVEERLRAERGGWSLAWALPRAGAAVPQVLHAPTPTAEPMRWPALLIASLPVEASRRAVVEGPAGEQVITAAAGAYAELLAERAEAGDDVLPLVPVGLGAGPFDVALREAAITALSSARVLRGAAGDGAARPRQARALEDVGRSGVADDPAVLAGLAPLVAGLVAAPRGSAAALAALGVERISLAEVADALPRDPASWLRAAAPLADACADPQVREQLAAAPVPLADGRVARGARGLLLPVGGEDQGGGGERLRSALAVLARRGVRVVDPGVAAHPRASALLTALGAVPASARRFLADPATAAAIREDDGPADSAEEDADEEDADGADAGHEGLATAVLTLAAAALADGDLRPGDLPILADLLLTSDDGEVMPAAGLVLPHSTAAGLLDLDEVAIVEAALLARWGADVLEAVGVARTLALVRFADVAVDDPPDDLLDVDGAPSWLADAARRAGEGAVASSVVVIRDLDLVRRGAEPKLLAALAGDRALRDAVVEPVRWVTPSGSVLTASQPAQWVGEATGLRGCAAPGAAIALARLLPPVPPRLAEPVATLDPVLGSAVGLISAWGDCDASAWARLLADLSSGARRLPGAGDLLSLWSALAQAAQRPGGLGDFTRRDGEPPARVVALDALDVPVLVDAADAVVVDDPRWAQRRDVGARVVVGSSAALAVADVLDLDLSSDRADGRVGAGVDGEGSPTAVPDAVRAWLPPAPARWYRHEVLRVDGADVAWWVERSGEDAAVHASSSRGLACALAWAAGAWERRASVEALLTGEGALAAMVEDAAG